MLTLKFLKRFCQHIPKPPNPTVPFGMIQKPPENLMNPKGFIPEKDLDNYEETKKEDISKEDNEPIKYTEEGKPLPKEIGFRYKGPEPTKFGDWAHKGRCTDF